jgi:hypothetical protein
MVRQTRFRRAGFAIGDRRRVGRAVDESDQMGHCLWNIQRYRMTYKHSECSQGSIENMSATPKEDGDSER